MKPSDIQYIAVHCSATPAKMDIGVPEIRRWHKQKGWLDIGYHFVIRRDGTLEGGRPENQQGAHVEGYNHCSIGVCLVGGLAKDAKTAENNFTEDQMQELAALLLELRQRYPNAVVQGHRDFLDVHKDCPSFDVRAWMKGLGL